MVKSTRDSGFILVGKTGAMGNNYDLLMMKTDDTGKIIWSKTYGSSIKSETGWAVTQAANGDFLVAGEATSLNDTGKIFYLRTDSVGNVIFSNYYRVGFGGSYAKYISELSDHSVIIGGDLEISDSFWTTISDVFLLKIDSIGQPLWAKSYNMGYYDELRTIQPTFDSGFILLSFSYDDTYRLPSLIKTDSNGDTLWTKMCNFWEAGPGYVIQTIDSGYMVSGYSQPGLFGPTYLKTDKFGADQFCKLIPLSGSFNYIKQTASGYVFIGSGYISGHSSDIIFERADTAGNVCGDSVPTSVINSAYPLQFVPPVAIYPAIDSMNIITFQVSSPVALQSDICQSLNVHNVTESHEFSIYPNPSSGLVNIHFASTAPIKGPQLTITTISGSVVLNEAYDDTSAFDKTINLSNLPSGIYFIELTAENFKQVKKLVVR
jgi:hypothetical protein